MRLKITTEKIICKICGSPRIVKYGHYGENQHWLCRDCGKKFTDSKAVVHGKLPSDCVSFALGAYYDGMSINAIRRNLKQQYEVYPSSATVFEWINKYTKEIIEKTKDLKPSVSNTWVADETYVRIDKRKKTDAVVENPYEKGKKGKWVIFWDIIDANSRFLLASVVTTTREIKDARKLMELAAKRAGKNPKVVVTDRLASYLDGIELAYGSDTKHRQGSPFEIKNNTNLIERFHSTLKMRTRVMRALRNPVSTQFFTDGWLAYYNFLKNHMALDNKTPARKAKIVYPFHDWADIVKVPQDNTVHVEVTKSSLPIKVAVHKLKPHIKIPIKEPTTPTLRGVRL